MNRIISILIVVTLLNLSQVFSQKTQLVAKWQTDKYFNIEDVSNMDFLYDSEEKLLYIVSNDENNIYVHLRTISEMPERKIIDFGFSIEIKLKGDKTKRIIEYPLPREERAKPVILIENNSNERRQNFNLIKEQVIKQIYTIRLTGFNEEVELVKSSENEFGIFGEMKINKNTQLQYLVTIPIKSLGFNLQDDVSLTFNLKSGRLENSINQDALLNSGQDMTGRQVGRNQQGGMGQPGIGQQGMPQGNRGGQQGNLGASMPQQMIERGPMSNAINIKLKNLVLLKEAEKVLR